MKSVLYVTNELNDVDGVTNHVYLLVKHISSLSGFKVFVLAGGGDKAEDFSKLKCEVDVNSVLNHKRRSLKNFAEAIKFVRDFSKKNSVGIIHSHNHYAANIAYYGSKFLNVKTVQTNHGLFADTGRLNLHKADYHVVLNSEIYEYIRGIRGIKKQSVRLIRPGVENVFTGTRVKTPNSFHASSRFVKDKGLDKYIIAANEINRKHPGKYTFSISGRGEEELKLRSLNDSLGGAVRFIKEYYNALSAASVFVFTSERISEGIPAVILEAIMAGCLVVSSDYKGAAEIFPTEYGEMLFKQGIADSLREKMICAADNTDSLIRKHEKMYKQVSDVYSADRMIEGHLKLYEEILRAK